MNLAKIPFPKSDRPSFLKAVTAISLTVIFILTVLQPFGTAKFQHEYKYLLLSGYGVTIFLGGMLYYFITDYILTDTTKDRWSILHEVLFLFGNLILCLLSCFLYWSFAFRGSFDINHFFSFILSAFSVAIFPVVVYLMYIYSQYKGVVMSGNISEKETEILSLIILGTNKNERVELNADHLLFVESNNNYVILNMLKDDVITRKMIRCTLNNVLGQLDDDFMKCHRSYIVNLNKIIDLSGNITNSKLQLIASDTKIPVSRSQVDALRDLLGK